MKELNIFSITNQAFSVRGRLVKSHRDEFGHVSHSHLKLVFEKMRSIACRIVGLSKNQLKVKLHSGLRMVEENYIYRHEIGLDERIYFVPRLILCGDGLIRFDLEVFTNINSRNEPGAIGLPVTGGYTHTHSVSYVMKLVDLKTRKFQSIPALVREKIGLLNAQLEASYRREPMSFLVK